MRPSLSVALWALCISASAAIFPRAWCSLGADGYWRRDASAALPLADAVSARALRGIERGAIQTGSPHFDGEWALVANQMTALGLSQLVRTHPSLRARYLPAIRESARRALSAASLSFGARGWSEDPEASLANDHGHAYLGYALMATAVWRELDPSMPTEERDRHDRFTAAMVRRIERAPYGMIETFPGVTFPADVASVLGAIALYDRSTGQQTHRPLIDRWKRTVRERYYDGATGLLCQTADPLSGRCTSGPRASGTAIAAYFISFADADFARELHAGLTSQRRTLLGFGGVREYAEQTHGIGDIDSGPVVLGVSVAATGFALGPARIFDDRDGFESMYRTASLFGAPRYFHGGYIAGETLGDAILLAMMTAESTR